jgi:hypothetical protein
MMFEENQDAFAFRIIPYAPPKNANRLENGA